MEKVTTGADNCQMLWDRSLCSLFMNIMHFLYSGICANSAWCLVMKLTQARDYIKVTCDLQIILISAARLGLRVNQVYRQLRSISNGIDIAWSFPISISSQFVFRCTFWILPLTIAVDVMRLAGKCAFSTGHSPLPPLTRVCMLVQSRFPRSMRAWDRIRF